MILVLCCAGVDSGCNDSDDDDEGAEDDEDEDDEDDEGTAVASNGGVQVELLGGDQICRSMQVG